MKNFEDGMRMSKLKLMQKDAIKENENLQTHYSYNCDEDDEVMKHERLR